MRLERNVALLPKKVQGRYQRLQLFDWCTGIETARGVKGATTPNILAYFVVLSFEMRCPKANTVARLKAKVIAPSENFRLATSLRPALDIKAETFLQDNRSLSPNKPYGCHTSVAVA